MTAGGDGRGPRVGFFYQGRPEFRFCRETLEQRLITESGTFPRAMQQLREEIVMHLVYAAPSWCNTHYSYAN